MSDQKKRPLTVKQFTFCKWYTSKECFGNATESARRAGYKGNDSTLAQVGAENIRKPHVAEMIEELLDAATAGANITVERVLKDIHEGAEQALEAGNYSAYMKGKELQGKHLKMWVERIEHVQNLDDITDDQLAALITKLSERIGVDFFSTVRGDGPEDSPVPGAAGAGKPH